MTDEFRADLHCHSTFSDGTLKPREILQLAKETGLQGLSITDHDTCGAYPAVQDSAKEMGIKMITGIEFSAVHRDASIHILGYGFEIGSDSIIKLCNRHKARRENRLVKMVKLLGSHGMPLELKEVIADGNIGRPHIAQAMLKRGYVRSIPEAFNKWLGEGKPCFSREESVSVEETIEAIHNGGGAAIIAHPHVIKNAQITRELLDMPFDGLEGHYARFPTGENARWIKMAREKGWLVTGGSDFHGSVKPDLPLGASWVNEERWNALVNR